MAIYHFSAKVISRGKGQSAVATAAYNARDKLTDERTGELKDFTRKGGLIFSGLFLPADAPAWAKDRGQLWNKAEEAEKRIDSTLARNYEISLPHELTDEQRRYAIQDFIRDNFTRKGYAADLAIHAPDKEGDERNYHAHILVTDRRLLADGFAPDKSERKLKSPERKAELETLRESWEKTGNRHLERHGFEPTLDRRTLTEQGIDREAGKHIGVHAMAMERKGMETERGSEAREIVSRNQEAATVKADIRELEHQLERTAIKTATLALEAVAEVAEKSLEFAADSLASLFDTTPKPQPTREQRERAKAYREEKQGRQEEKQQETEKERYQRDEDYRRALLMQEIAEEEAKRQREDYERGRDRTRER